MTSIELEPLRSATARQDQDRPAWWQKLDALTGGRLPTM